MIESSHLIIKYDGLDTTDKAIELQGLGRSLIGIDKLIRKSLFYIETGKQLKRIETSPFVVKTKQPREGSILYDIYLTSSVYFAPLLHDFYLTDTHLKRYLPKLISGIMLKMAGYDKKANNQLEIAKLIFENQEKERQNITRLIEGERLHTENIIRYFVQDAKESVFPVGKNCDKMSVSGSGEEVVFDTTMADSIRSNGNLEVEDMELLTTTINGYIIDQKQIKIPHPEEENGGLLIGRVTDPEFDKIPNIYLDALGSRKPVILNIRKRRNPNGRLKDVFVSGAKAP